MSAARFPSPHFTRLLQLAATLLVVVYMVFIGGSFDAVVRFRVQLLSTLAGGALALAWLAVRLRQRTRLVRSGLEWPLLVMVLGQWIAALAAPQPRLSLETAASVTAWAIVFIILCDLLTQGWPRAYVANALLTVALVIAAQALWALVSWAAPWLSAGQWPPFALRSYRPYTSIGNPNLIAIILNLLLPLCLAPLLGPLSRTARTFLSGGLVLILAAIIVAASRAGWIVVMMTLGLMAGLLWWRPPAWSQALVGRWQRRPPLMRLASLALALATLGLAARLFLVPATDYLLGARLEYWRPAWLMFLASPLTGGGPGQHLEFITRFFSVPPQVLFSHGHSLIIETLGSSGLVGGLGVLAVVVAGVIILRRRWRQTPDRVWMAALISGLAGACLHQITDHFLGTPSFAFLFILVSALALAPTREAHPSPDLPSSRKGSPSPEAFTTAATVHPAWLALPIALVLGITAFALRGAAFNTRGVELANRQRWAEAGQAFQQAALRDPALALYWENAAQALTRTGALDQAILMWQQAVRLEPRWALDTASLAMLTHDADRMEAALALAPQSYLMALNVGVLREANGENAAAQTAYGRALELAPTLAEALFWQQTAFRQSTLNAWRALQPADTSLAAQGWAAFRAQDFERARAIFEQLLREAPLSGPANLGMARTALALHDLDQAESYLQVSLNLQNPSVIDTLEYQMLQGDLAAARGDPHAAREAYTWVFGAVNDYTSIGGLGTYGNTARSGWLFHREGLPSDLIPQLARADVTADIDARLARLAQGYVAEGQTVNACSILAHAQYEAPVSESGRLFQRVCAAAANP